MFSLDPAKRPTIQEIKNHPWMKVEINDEKIRSEILEKLGKSNQS